MLGFFLPDPTNGGVQDVASWIILLFLYSTVFCMVWMMLLGAFNRWLPCLRQDDLQEYLGNTFLKLLWIIRSVLISSKELLFDFGSLFIFTAIVRASLNQVKMCFLFTLGFIRKYAFRKGTLNLIGLLLC